MPFYWKRGGAPLPENTAVNELKVYAHLGAQLRWIPKGCELFVPIGSRPETRRRQLEQLGATILWEQVHIVDRQPKEMDEQDWLK